MAISFGKTIIAISSFGKFLLIVKSLRETEISVNMKVALERQD